MNISVTLRAMLITSGFLTSAAGAQSLDTFDNLDSHPNGQNLNVYDSCTQQWLDTGLEYRSHPEFDEVLFDSDKDYLWGKVFNVAGQSMTLKNASIYNLENHMNYTNPELPSSFRGIWWMDGNPVPEVVVTFGGGRFDAEQNKISFYYNGPRTYAFHQSALSEILWKITHAVESFGTIEFAPEIDLESPVSGETGQLLVDNQFFNQEIELGNMSVTFVQDGHWRRLTGQGPTTHCYNLRRIVDEYGQKLPVYDYFLLKTQQEADFLGVRNKNVLIHAVETSN